MTEPTVVWNSPYPISDAENGKFVHVDMSGITGYAALSANDSYRGHRYAVLVKSVESGSEAFSADTVWVASSAIAAATAYSPTPPATLSEVEISNNSGGSIYFLPSATSYAQLSANGIIIANNTYYSQKKSISSFTIGSSAGGDVRVLGHYKA